MRGPSTWPGLPAIETTPALVKAKEVYGRGRPTIAALGRFDSDIKDRK